MESSSTQLFLLDVTSMDFALTDEHRMPQGSSVGPSSTGTLALPDTLSSARVG
jgi:hypothetical protein